jgi:hydroxypyruvate isomerase
MPKFAANLSFLFMEFDFYDRFEAAAHAGFKGVEFHFPYDFEKTEIAERLDANGLSQVLHNMPAGDWTAGERGIACLPDRVGEFQDNVGLAIENAEVLGCFQVNCLSGVLPEGLERETAVDVLIHNLIFASAEFKKASIRLLIEPINRFDVPGFLLNTSNDGMSVIEAVGSDNLFLQYDIYHMQRMEGELANTIDALLPKIAHMQIADTPGRHEPGTGEINYDFLFNHIDSTTYDGWIGCEYVPRSGTVAGLAWMDSCR